MGRNVVCRKTKVRLLRTSATCGLAFAAIWFLGVHCFASDLQTFETDHYKLTLDHACNVVGLDWKTPELRVIQEPRLGESFRIVLPEPGYEGNILKGRTKRQSGSKRIQVGLPVTSIS